MDLISSVTGSGALGWLYGFWQLATCRDAATSGDLAQETYTPGRCGRSEARAWQQFQVAAALKETDGRIKLALDAPIR